MPSQEETTTYPGIMPPEKNMETITRFRIGVRPRRNFLLSG